MPGTTSAAGSAHATQATTQRAQATPGRNTCIVKTYTSTTPSWVTSSEPTQSETLTRPTLPPNPEARLAGNPTPQISTEPAPIASSGRRRVLRASRSMRTPTTVTVTT